MRFTFRTSRISSSRSPTFDIPISLRCASVIIDIRSPVILLSENLGAMPPSPSWSSQFATFVVVHESTSVLSPSGAFTGWCSCRFEYLRPPTISLRPCMAEEFRGPLSAKADSL